MAVSSSCWLAADRQIARRLDGLQMIQQTEAQNNVSGVAFPNFKSLMDSFLAPSNEVGDADTALI